MSQMFEVTYNDVKNINITYNDVTDVNVTYVDVTNDNDGNDGTF